MKLERMINKKLEKVLPTNLEMNNLVRKVAKSMYAQRVFKMPKPELIKKIKERIPPRKLIMEMLKARIRMKLK